MSEHPDGVLSGSTVALTAHRRAREQAVAFERHGARTVHAPALKLAPVDEDTPVLEATRAVLDSAPATVLITTGYGLDRWLRVAAAAGLEDQLLAHLRGATVLARGAKARGRLQALGIPCAHVGTSGTTRELVDEVIASGTPGHVVLQEHGTSDHVQLGRLRAAGHRVDTVTPYQWESADAGGELTGLCRAIVAGDVDYVTFTAAPAVDALFDAARSAGLHAALVEALTCGPCIPVAIGPVCVQPLEDAGITRSVVPERFRLGAMVKAVCEHARAHPRAE